MKDRTLFGLDEGDIRAIVARAMGQPVSSLTFALEAPGDGHPGYQAEKAVATFEYTTQDGQAGRIAMFVKRHNEPRHIEGNQFRHLEQHGAPIPRLYGAVRDAEGREILFIEHLSSIYSQAEVYGSPELFGRFIRLIARLNSIPVDRHYEALPHHGAVHPIPAQQVDAVAKIAEHAARGQAGGELAALLTSVKGRPSELRAKLQRLGQVVAGFPRGFVHGDLWPYHVGSRAGSDEMLAVDLGLSLHASRFFDIAPFIGPSDDLPPLSLSREDIAACYVDEYVTPDGGKVRRADLLAEADAVWLAWNSRRLGWQLKRTIGGEVAAQRKTAWLLGLLSQWDEGEQLRPRGPQGAR